jgi:sulfite reductase beta subunit-like hemoprotein
MSRKRKPEERPIPMRENMTVEEVEYEIYLLIEKYTKDRSIGEKILTIKRNVGL